MVGDFRILQCNILFYLKLCSNMGCIVFFYLSSIVKLTLSPRLFLDFDLGPRTSIITTLCYCLQLCINCTVIISHFGTSHANMHNKNLLVFSGIDKISFKYVVENNMNLSCFMRKRFVYRIYTNIAQCTILAFTGLILQFIHVYTSELKNVSYNINMLHSISEGK